MDRAKISRINELAKKQKTVGLTDADKEEQSRLRHEYLALVRRSFKAQLDSIRFTDDTGSDTPEQ